MWRYLAVMKLSALFRGMNFKINGDFYCLDCLYLFRTKIKLASCEKVSKDHDFLVKLKCMMKKVKY